MYSLVPECYFVLSAIRIRMSFLVLFKYLHELEGIALCKWQAWCSCFTIDFLMERLLLWMVFSLCLLFRKPPDRFFSMNGCIIETKLQRPRIMRWLLVLVLFALGMVQKSVLVPPDPTAFDQFAESLVHPDVASPTACAAAFVAGHDVSSLPREMGSWDSDGFPVVLDSGTSKSITPVYSDLINPRPFES